MILTPDNFTPFTAILGGVLIGVAAVMLMLFNGRIAGVSGIFSGMLFGESGDKLWRWMFVAGLLLGPVIYSAITNTTPEFTITRHWFLVIAGGVFVGFGTQLGSGCTSGHGVCGLSRFSLRSAFAVCIFLVSGVSTVAVVNQLSGT